jgi:hypothetical protein
MKRAELFRKLLRSEQYSDGLSAPQLAALGNVDVGDASKVLRSMPDSYIDRWEMSQGKPHRFLAIWCVVQPPDDCPKPELRKPEPQPFTHTRTFMR